ISSRKRVRAVLSLPGSYKIYNMKSQQILQLFKIQKVCFFSAHLPAPSHFFADAQDSGGSTSNA
ncbi:MAG: hypothetical protein LBS42_10475, partial [Tannerella sp.]|nr:hypothetical protein [Tannerella sp.]